ncbi:ABC-type proline/glycine betaine transport system substrate-binding protein [Sinorhizobium fredii]
MRNILAFSALALVMGAASAAKAECGTVTVANMNWQSGELLANVDKFVLEHGFGCEVEFIPGDTVPTITSMVEKGEPDIAGEAWVDLVPEIVKRGTEEGRIVQIGQALSDGGVQGWYIPKFIVNAHPEIKTVDDALAILSCFRTRRMPPRGRYSTVRKAPAARSSAGSCSRLMPEHRRTSNWSTRARKRAWMER